MRDLKRGLLLALALFLLPSAAWAQCNGVFGAGQACGSVSGGPPGQIPFSAISSIASVSNVDGTLTISPTIGNVVASINLASANTWTATITIDPPSGTAKHGLIIKQTGPAAGTLQASFNYNGVAITDTTDNSSGASGVVSGWYNAMTTGGSGTGGSVWDGWDDVLASNPGTSNSGDMIGRVSRCVMSASFSSGVGGCYGASFQGILLSGGALNTTNGEVAGAECDSRIDSGASAAWHIGCGAVNTGAESGTLLDSAFEVGASVAGWEDAFLLNSGHGQAPLTTTGCVICTDGVSETIATGIDLSAYTISGNFLKGPGFAVSGTGAVNGIALSVKNGTGTAAVGQLAATITGVNFNSANTDNAIAIPLPSGYSSYRITGILISNASASLTNATVGVFTATGGGGTAIVSAGTAMTINTSSANTNNNQQVLTFGNSNTEALNISPLYFRIGTAEGSAATATVTLLFQPAS